MKTPGGLPRLIEAPVALVLLAASAPLLAVLAMLTLVTSGRPVLFRQERVGRHGRTFRLTKLRTMRSGARGAPITSRADPRITSLGRLLRRLKLDELPELAHVVRGEMAFVGPRPEVPRFVDLASPAWQEVLSVRPGLTDPVTLRLYDEEALLAEAGGDPETFYCERLLPFKLQAYLAYLRERTWWTDLRVVGATVLALFGHRGPGRDAVRLQDLEPTDPRA